MKQVLNDRRKKYFKVDISTCTLYMLPSTLNNQEQRLVKLLLVFTDDFEQVIALWKKTVFAKREIPYSLIVVVKRELPFLGFLLTQNTEYFLRKVKEHKSVMVM